MDLKKRTDKQTDTLCFNIEILENDISILFYKIISNIENLFDVNLRTNISFTNKIHTNFKFKNCLIEIKITKQEKVYSLGYTQIRLKIFTQKQDIDTKEKFGKLCTHIPKLN